MNLNKGFTLIELLVVISIIGLFSSIVLAGLNSARDKAKDAKIMQEVRQLATLHALEFSEKNTYSNFNRGAWRNTTGVGSGYRLCTGETSVDTTVSPFVSSASNFANQGIDLCKSIVNTVGSVRNDILYNGVNGTNWDSTKVWSIMAYLPGKNGFFCIGSSGRTSIGVSSAAANIDIPPGTEGAKTTGTVSTVWSGPGCYGNP